MGWAVVRAWSSPEFAGRTVTGKMLVVGVTQDETVRRLYEDAMVVRQGWRAVVVPLQSADARWTESLLAGARVKVAELPHELRERNRVNRALLERDRLPKVPACGLDRCQRAADNWPT